VNNLASVAFSAVVLAIAVINVTYFRRRPVPRAATLAVTAALGGSGAAAWHVWWLAGVWLVLMGWGLARLAALASGRRP
jgi:hypothetical protein